MKCLISLKIKTSKCVKFLKSTMEVIDKHLNNYNIILLDIYKENIYNTSSARINHENTLHEFLPKHREHQNTFPGKVTSYFRVKSIGNFTSKCPISTHLLHPHFSNTVSP